MIVCHGLIIILHVGLVSSLISSDQKAKLSVPAKKPMVLTPSTSTKRRFTPSEFDDDIDSENIDPASSLSSTKRTKNNDSVPVKPSSTFHLTSTPKFTFTAPKPSSVSSMPPPSAIPARLQTPISHRRANIASPRAPLTAPAGRSPPSMRDNKHRRVSAPFSRIDPPSFMRASASSALPFSLDAALAGTLTNISSPKPASKPKMLQDGMPRNWFFEIYQDTPEEESATLMEHSTLTLDLSSDDETSKLNREDKGKENVAPPDYEAPSVSSRPTTSPARTSTVSMGKQPRRKVVKADDMEDGERSPLSDLETEDFLPAGVSKDDFIVIPPSPAKKEYSSVATSCEAPEENLFATDKAAISLDQGVVDEPVVAGEGHVEGEILIWEDDAKVADD